MRKQPFKLYEFVKVFSTSEQELDGSKIKDFKTNKVMIIKE